MCTGENVARGDHRTRQIRKGQQIRRRRGLSLDVAAGLAGIGPSYLSMLERGQHGFNWRGLTEDLAEALGCSVAICRDSPICRWIGR